MPSRILIALAAVLTIALPARAAEPAVATFAGGCFWCTESDFEKLPGVLSALSGYIGGHVAHPSYEAVSAGRTGHAEAVEIRFDPEVVSYDKLLQYYWKSVDPFTPNAQFCDHGSQYRSAIFYYGEAQRQAALRSKAALEEELRKAGRLDTPIVTEIVAASTFYPAEEYHQDYYKKNPIRYRYYRSGCGRDRKLEELWGDSASH